MKVTVPVAAEGEVLAVKTMVARYTGFMFEEVRVVVVVAADAVTATAEELLAA
jgi:hypothetical protein